MFTDLVGYTALSQRDEALALRMLAKHREIVRPVFKRYGGREIKTIGDAFLVEFDSAIDATRCAVDVQKILHDYNEKSRVKLQVRIGVHIGDIVHQEGDVYGDAVNIASRIEPLADAGSVCISEQVYYLVRNKIPYPLVKLESQNLKNVAFPVDVYKVILPWSKSALKGQKDGPDSAVSLVTKYQPEEKERLRSVGKYFLKLTLKNRIVVVTLTNEPRITGALAKFAMGVDYARGETLHIVAGIETVKVVTDQKNLEKLYGLIPKKRFINVIEDLSEIIVSLAETVTSLPGVVAAITTHLAAAGINLVEYITINPHEIVVVEEKDALKSYQLLEELATGAAK